MPVLKHLLFCLEGILVSFVLNLRDLEDPVP